MLHQVQRALGDRRKTLGNQFAECTHSVTSTRQSLLGEAYSPSVFYRTLGDRVLSATRTLGERLAPDGVGNGSRPLPSEMFAECPGAGTRRPVCVSPSVGMQELGELWSVRRVSTRRHSANYGQFTECPHAGTRRT